mmetsp:Transcript_73449/g.207429  ORF Transcript_73449/g.207429 Transcript_73449/m.207429 type:complete len:286 (-) Transcript_73449:82-939(-)
MEEAKVLRSLHADLVHAPLKELVLAVHVPRRLPVQGVRAELEVRHEVAHRAAGDDLERADEGVRAVPAVGDVEALLRHRLVDQPRDQPLREEHRVDVDLHRPLVRLVDFRIPDVRPDVDELRSVQPMPVHPPHLQVRGLDLRGVVGRPGAPGADLDDLVREDPPGRAAEDARPLLQLGPHQLEVVARPPRLAEVDHEGFEAEQLRPRGGGRHDVPLVPVGQLLAGPVGGLAGTTCVMTRGERVVLGVAATAGPLAALRPHAILVGLRAQHPRGPYLDRDVLDCRC